MVAGVFPAHIAAAALPLCRFGTARGWEGPTRGKGNDRDRRLVPTESVKTPTGGMLFAPLHQMRGRQRDELVGKRAEFRRT